MHNFGSGFGLSTALYVFSTQFLGQSCLVDYRPLWPINCTILNGPFRSCYVISNCWTKFKRPIFAFLDTENALFEVFHTALEFEMAHFREEKIMGHFRSTLIPWTTLVRLTIEPNIVLLVMVGSGFGLGTIIAVGVLLYSQIKITLKNETSIESWIIEKANWRRKEVLQIQEKYVFPYDLG